ncbi:MAG TPA: hypothetical protein VF601_03200 [Beijerinckiaceae bacterium]|jgi:hypothetical protein
MKTSSRALLPVLALAAAVAANEPAPPAPRQEPEATGTAIERAQADLRPAQDAIQPEKRPAVRVILPSPYSSRP